MTEGYISFLRGVPLQTLARIKPRVPGQREDVRTNGSRLTLFDMSNRIKDEADMAETFLSHITNGQIFDSQLRGYISQVIQGTNLAVLAIGATGSGKSHTIGGSMNDSGLAHQFVDDLLNALADQESKQPLKYSLRMQYVEIINEDMIDLLSKGKGLITTEPDEWEGTIIKGAERKVVKSAQQFTEIYRNATANRVTLVNEFGRLADKTTAILAFDLLQTFETANDTRVLLSKILFVESPGTEILRETAEIIVTKEGPTLNKGIFALQDVAIDLSSGHMPNANYDISQVTKLLTEALGGNSMTIAIFNFQCEDIEGSLATMGLLKRFQRIVNFPITNDNKAVCLLHKYRKANSELRKRVYGPRGETLESYQQMVEEMQKKYITENLNGLTHNEERRRLNTKINEMKERFNELLKEKADMKTQLLSVEEEKLDLSKVVLELQIENSKLQQEIENIRYEYDAGVIHKDANIQSLSSSKTKAQQKILELQGSLEEMKSEKQEFEIELTSLKRNYLSKCKEIEDLKRKNQEISVELINAMNEKSLSSTHMKLKKDSERELTKTSDRATMSEMARLKEELSQAVMENQRLSSENIRMEALMDQLRLDFDKKRIALEKEYVALAKSKNAQVNVVSKVDKERAKSKATEENLWGSEKQGLEDEVQELQRHLDVAVSETRELREQNDELTIEKRGLEMQVDELTAQYRNRLEQVGKTDVNKELVGTYVTKENELTRELSAQRSKVAKLQMKCRTLREYARQLKCLCEDVYPEDRMKPDVLQGDEPFIVDEEIGDIEKLAKERDTLQIELSKLREENKSLKDNVKGQRPVNNNQVSEAEIRKKILEEVKMLKSSSTSRPPSGREDFEFLRKERNKLLEENMRLKQMAEYDSSVPTSGGGLKQLKHRIVFLEASVRDLEKERSELTVRATIAEQQLKTLQDCFTKTTQDYQKKIVELKKRLSS